MIVNVCSENFYILEAFASETRIRILELLDEKPMNIREIAEKLEISSTIVAKHISKLEKAGIIKSETSPGKRGTQKVSSIQLDQMTLLLRKNKNTRNVYTYSIPIGQYSNYHVKPTCGLASTAKIIGLVDDPRYFADPEHINASFLWLAGGWVEYRIPNYLLRNQKINSIEFMFEICSEAPGYNDNWPSDITFSINNHEVGMWTCPGDFGNPRGVFNPLWWPSTHTQYGLLKTVIVNEQASFLDGITISDKTISNLNISYGKEIIFKIASEESTVNQGGLCLFGKGFGNYNMDIEVVIEYEYL